jgi:hypothetical protein
MRDPMEIFEDWLKKHPRAYAKYIAKNFCKGEFADGQPKPASRLFDIYYRVFYLQCPCCAALRGLLLGLVLGWGLKCLVS